jgi:hypothetical protein
MEANQTLHYKDLNFQNDQSNPGFFLKVVAAVDVAVFLIPTKQKYLQRRFEFEENPIDKSVSELLNTINGLRKLQKNQKDLEIDRQFQEQRFLGQKYSLTLVRVRMSVSLGSSFAPSTSESEWSRSRWRVFGMKKSKRS